MSKEGLAQLEHKIHEEYTLLREAEDPVFQATGQAEDIILAFVRWTRQQEAVPADIVIKAFISMQSTILLHLLGGVRPAPGRNEREVQLMMMQSIMAEIHEYTRRYLSGEELGDGVTASVLQVEKPN